MAYNNAKTSSQSEASYFYQQDRSPIEAQAGGDAVRCSFVLSQFFWTALQDSLSGHLDPKFSALRPWTDALTTWFDAYQSFVDGFLPQNLDFGSFLDSTSNIDQLLGPQLLGDIKLRQVHASNVVVIEYLLKYKFGQIHIPDGNALCGLWFLRTLGAVLTLERNHNQFEIMFNTSISYFVQKSDLVHEFQSFCFGLGNSDSAQMNQSDMYNCPQHIASGAICSVSQLQIHLLDTAAQTFSKQMDSLANASMDSTRSMVFFSLVSSLIERFAPITPKQSGREAIEHIRTALQCLRDFAGLMLAPEFLAPIAFAGGSLNSSVHTSHSGTSSLPRCGSEQSLSTSSSTSSLPGPDPVTPMFASAMVSSPESYSPIIPNSRIQGFPKKFSTKCRFCGRTLSSDDNEQIAGRIRRHTAHHCNGQRDKPQLVCGALNCGKKYTRSDSRLVHERREHPELNRKPKRNS